MRSTKRTDLRDLLGGWTEEANRASRNRAAYQAMCQTEPSDRPKQECEALQEVLELALLFRESPLMTPGVQQDLRARATILFDRVLGLLLPWRPDHTKLPSGKRVDVLVSEAKFALDALVTLEASAAEGRRSAAYLRVREQLVQRWVERNMPLSATERDLRRASAKCAKLTSKMQGTNATTEDALEMVAALFDTSRGMVKKARSRRLHERSVL